FVVLSGLVFSLDKQQKSPWGEKVQAAVLFSPTVFGIMYAAIMGKALRRLGLFKAERGVKLRTLERLIGSQSVYSAVERQIGLRNLDFLGIFLILLWLLSPLGGQASLRIMSTEPRIVDLNETARYFPVEGYLTSILFAMNTLITSWNTYAPLYMTSLHLSRSHLYSPLDLWGGIKIPDIETSSEVEDGWIKFRPEHNTTYVSHLGVPVVGVPERGNSTFNMVSHYWTVACGEFRPGYNVSWSEEENEQIPGREELPSRLTFKMEVPNENETFVDVNEKPTRFTYTSLRGDVYDDVAPNVIRSNCSIGLAYVESRVDCIGRNCRVGAMRPFDMKGRRPFPTIFVRNILGVMPGTDTGLTQLMRPVLDSSTMTEKWIANPTTTFELTDDENYVNLASMPTAVFSKRLQMAINTFWDSTVANQYRMTNLAVSNYTICPANSCPRGLSFNSTALSGTKFEGEQYVCNRLYTIITIIVSWVIFVSAVISLVLAACLTTAPDILGFVSTCLRDSPYVEAQTTSHVDGLDTARTHGDVCVMIGDVRSDSVIGHAAFATMGAGVKRLEKDKLYD
ncbi:hypothetical protein M011DRAFT_412427, partial [Sporormia fimetaria CBS 119925]